MKFNIGSSENINVTDDEIFQLLFKVYVDAGFTSEEVAKKYSLPELYEIEV